MRQTFTTYFVVLEKMHEVIFLTKGLIDSNSSVASCCVGVCTAFMCRY